MKSSPDTNSLKSVFNSNVSIPKTGIEPKRSKKKRPSPLSLRLSPSERAKLEKLANGLPISTYAKSILLDEGVPKARTRGLNPVQDYEALARVLGALGQSELYGNLSALIEQIESGKVALTPQTEEQIGVACACILMMRNDLVKALGLVSSED